MKTEEGKLVKKLEHATQDEKGRLRWPELPLVRREVGENDQRLKVVDNEHLYQTSLSMSHMKSLLRRVLRKSSTEVGVIKIQVSGAELDLAEHLRSEKIRFKLKTYITRRRLVDFLILPRGGRRIVLDIAYSYRCRPLRDNQIARLKSIPLEVVRSFFEDYICRIRPLTGERLEKLISHGLLNENKRRTVIGRMLMKAFRETVKNQTYAHGDTRHVLLNNSGADLYGKRV